MKTFWWRLILTAVAILGMELGAKAQDVKPPSPPTEPGKTEVLPVIDGNSIVYPEAVYYAPQPNILNRLNLACYTEPTNPQCTNLRNELRFVFGTCRQFFYESCDPNPNPRLRAGGAPAASSSRGILGGFFKNCFCK